MLKVAILETEHVTKDIIFELGKLFSEYVWTFQYFTSIVDFAKADDKQCFDMLIFHEKFNTERIYSSLLSKNQRFIIFTCDEDKDNIDTGVFSRILFINKRNIKEEIQKYKNAVISWIKEQQEYLFSYNGVKLALAIHEIHYIEKQNKNLIFHTDKGELSQRGSMSETLLHFEPLNFLHIHSSYLVNIIDIIKIDGDYLTMRNEELLPISRSRKQYVKEYFHKFIN